MSWNEATDELHAHQHFFGYQPSEAYFNRIQRRNASAPGPLVGENARFEHQEENDNDDHRVSSDANTAGHSTMGDGAWSDMGGEDAHNQTPTPDANATAGNPATPRSRPWTPESMDRGEESDVDDEDSDTSSVIGRLYCSGTDDDDPEEIARQERLHSSGSSSTIVQRRLPNFIYQSTALTRQRIREARSRALFRRSHGTDGAVFDTATSEQRYQGMRAGGLQRYESPPELSDQWQERDHSPGALRGERVRRFRDSLELTRERGVPSVTDGLASTHVLVLTGPVSPDTTDDDATLVGTSGESFVDLSEASPSDNQVTPSEASDSDSYDRLEALDEMTPLARIPNRRLSEDEDPVVRGRSRGPRILVPWERLPVWNSDEDDGSVKRGRTYVRRMSARLARRSTRKNGSISEVDTDDNEEELNKLTPLQRMSARACSKDRKSEEHGMDETLKMMSPLRRLPARIVRGYGLRCRHMSADF